MVYYCFGAEARWSLDERAAHEHHLIAGACETTMAGIANGSEWIAVGKLKEIIASLPDDNVVQASSLGNLVIYDAGGPIDGKMVAYIDLLTETMEESDAESE